MAERTIAAISTPLGEGGIGVIRISGDDALKVADKCFCSLSGEKLSSLKGYRAAYGNITDNNGTVIDNAVATVFRAPKSYTGEDVVEFSAHGGTLVLRKVLRRVLECGAHTAGGGEFTKRAFLNGKLDLAEAESVMGLISARNDASLKISRAAQNGRISRTTQNILDSLLETAASIAAFADYPDEDIPELRVENFSALLKNTRLELSKLISSYDAGKIVREGIDCCIVGKPNVGKSTLMNLLCGCERSIVTDIAGTTRDIIENTVTIDDITLNLSDTAGIHNTDDTVEKFGVQRAEEKIESAELILAVFDSSAALCNDDLKLLDEIKDKKVIIILNKTDLKSLIEKSRFDGLRTVEISAKSGKGYNELVNAIKDISRISMLSPDDTVLITERQFDCARRAFDATEEALSALCDGVTLDAVGICVDDAISALLELTGKRVTNEVCDEVFRRFCVGK